MGFDSQQVGAKQLQRKHLSAFKCSFIVKLSFQSCSKNLHKKCQMALLSISRGIYILATTKVRLLKINSPILIDVGFRSISLCSSWNILGCKFWPLLKKRYADVKKQLPSWENVHNWLYILWNLEWVLACCRHKVCNWSVVYHWKINERIASCVTAQCFHKVFYRLSHVCR